MCDSVFVARRVQVSPGLIGPALQEWHRDASRKEPFRMYRGGPSLWLANEPTDLREEPFPIAELSGLLWISPWPLKVTVEWAPWSDDETEVGLRPNRLAWPVGTDRYWRATRAALAELAASLEEWVRARPLIEDEGPRERVVRSQSQHVRVLEADSNHTVGSHDYGLSRV